MPEFAQLVEGYRRFRAGPYQAQKQRYDALAEQGQAPPVMVIGCSDSRVDPSQIFDAAPGQMFVVRNVAALVPPYDADGPGGMSAALEFAVTQLHVAKIIVLGHARCGGCAAALTGRFADAGEGQGGSIARWVSMLDGARERVLTDYGGDVDAHAHEAMEHEAVKVSLANLRGFPWVRAGEAAGTLRLHGAYFALADGRLQVLDEASGLFAPVAEAG